MKFISTYLFNTFFVLGFLDIVWCIVTGNICLPPEFVYSFFPVSLAVHIVLSYLRVL